MEVFTVSMTIAVIIVHSECPEMPNSRSNRERSYLLRGRIYLAIWCASVNSILDVILRLFDFTRSVINHHDHHGYLLVTSTIAMP